MSFSFVVNLHALTSVHDAKQLAADTLGAAADFMALGLDPERCHSYKDKVAKGIAASHGLFSYPVLMAADILIYQAEKVPVGKDQKQHLEVARDIAQKFNNSFGETFVLPEPIISDNLATVPGLDGQKMSKSYGNTIPIFMGQKALKKRVMAIVTDATPVEDPKDPEKCNLYSIFKLFAPADRLQEVHDLYVNGGAMYGKIKLELVDLLWEYFREARETRERLEDDHAYLRDVLKKGAEKARQKATVTLDLVRERVGLRY